MTEISKEVESWFNRQLDEGLVDIKISVIPGKNVSYAAVASELLAAEAAIAAGKFREPPLPKDHPFDAAIDQIMKNVRIEGC